MKELLELRNRMKKKKPRFARQDAHKKRKLGRKWRKPKGINAKLRQFRAGRARHISTGYGSPKKVRGLAKDGSKPALVTSKKELEKAKKDENGIIISSKVGDKKRAEIIKKAQEREIKIINIKDADACLKRIEESLKDRQENKKKKHERKKEKEEKEVKKKKEDNLAAKVSDEEKKEEGKKEKDRLLTKRDVK